MPYTYRMYMILVIQWQQDRRSTSDLAHPQRKTPQPTDPTETSITHDIAMNLRMTYTNIPILSSAQSIHLHSSQHHDVAAGIGGGGQWIIWTVTVNCIAYTTRIVCPSCNMLVNRQYCLSVKWHVSEMNELSVHRLSPSVLVVIWPNCPTPLIFGGSM